jgi:hypothetical protein
MDLTKETTDLNNEQYKTKRKEILKDAGRWKDYPCLWIGRINVVKMTIIESDLQISPTCIKFPMIVFREIENQS